MAVAEFNDRAMASEVHLLVADGDDNDSAFAMQRLRRLESLWSRFRPESEISALNNSRGHPVKVSWETCALVGAMVDAWELTGGLYDPTILPVLLKSGYRQSIVAPFVETMLPVECDGSVIGMAGVLIDEATRTVTLPRGLAIDPGGIGKGLAAQFVAEDLTNDGARGALINIGGDLATSGEAPVEGGWTVSVEDPLDPSSVLARFSIDRGSVATSSTLSRRFGPATRSTHHIIDPITRSVSRTSLAAVTTVANSAWLAEASAKALLIEDTDVLTAARGLGVEAIVTSLDGSTVATDGLRQWLVGSHAEAVA